MIVKVAGRAMMSLLCSVHLLCSDEQVFFALYASWSSTASILLQSYALRGPDSHLCQRVMLFLIHSLFRIEPILQSLRNV